MFGNKVTCADKIANKSLDVFAGAKAQIQKGIDDITVNRDERLVVLEDLNTKADAVKAEIEKDNLNINTLNVKLEALDKLI